MSSDGNNNYDIYSTENTSPLEEPDPIPPFELESTKSDTLEEYDVSDDGDDDDGEGGNNSRIFMILLGSLAGLFIISIIVMVLLSQVIMPGRAARQTEQAKLILGENEATISAATEEANAEAIAAELTRIAVEASPTPEPSNTPTETVMAPTEEPTSTPEPAQPTDTPEPVDVTPDVTQTEAALQATVDALATQMAASPTPTEEGAVAPTLNAAQMTATAMASGGTGGAGPGDDGGDDQLPDTGLMDGGGIYVMAIAALGLIGVIVGARKLRKAN